MQAHNFTSICIISPLTSAVVSCQARHHESLLPVNLLFSSFDAPTSSPTTHFALRTSICDRLCCPQFRDCLNILLPCGVCYQKRTQTCLTPWFLTARRPPTAWIATTFTLESLKFQFNICKNLSNTSKLSSVY